MKVSALLSGGQERVLTSYLPYLALLAPAPFSLPSFPSGVFLGHLGGDVPPGSQNPDLISDKNFHYPNPFSDLKSLTFVQNPLQIRILSCFLVHLELK